MNKVTGGYVAGIDAGTETIKVVVLREDATVAGISVVPTRGYFQACIQEAFANALDEAKVSAADLLGSGVTGFAASCAPLASLSLSETECHARAAFHRIGTAMTLVDIGGRDPQVIRVDGAGKVISSRAVRKCAVGIGTFLMFTARHLGVHPTRLMDLAMNATHASPIGSYCSVFAEVDVIERLRNGDTVEQIALGSIQSIADRIMEIGVLNPPVYATGGVCEYFPGVITTLSERAGVPVQVLADPTSTAAFGAALLALDSLALNAEAA
jgi:predicted CoA-substrate-specific enzyme activase